VVKTGVLFGEQEFLKGVTKLSLFHGLLKCCLESVFWDSLCWCCIWLL